MIPVIGNEIGGIQPIFSFAVQRRVHNTWRLFLTDILYVAFIVYTLFQFFKLYSYSTHSLQMIYIGAGILEIVATDFEYRNDLIQALVLKIFLRYLRGSSSATMIKNRE